MFGKSRHHRIDLEQHGKPAPAIVVEISDRGRAITDGADTIMSNTEIDLKTKLRVEPDDEPAFEVEQHFRYPQTAVPAVGSHLSVRYHPDDHHHIMIDRSTAGMTFGNTNAASLLRTIQSQQTGARDPIALANALADQIGSATNPAHLLFIGGQQASGLGRVPAAPVTSAAADPVEMLEKLAHLRDTGVLSDAEFRTQKARILSNGAPDA